MPRSEYCRYIAKVVMAVFGLTHTYNTKVGNDFIRGVSGGERKRVSIAEMVLAGSPFSAWDNRFALLSSHITCFSNCIPVPEDSIQQLLSNSFKLSGRPPTWAITPTPLPSTKPVRPSTIFSTKPRYYTRVARSTLVRQTKPRPTSSGKAGTALRAKRQATS